MTRVPAPSVLMRLLGFMVPSALALAAVQPLIGAAVGEVGAGWAVRMSAPALRFNAFVHKYMELRRHYV